MLFGCTVLGLQVMSRDMLGVGLSKASFRIGFRREPGMHSVS